MTNELADAAAKTGLVSSNGIPGIEGMGGKHLTVASIVLVQGTSSHFTSKGILPGKFANTLSEGAVENTDFVPAYLTEKLFVYRYTDTECKNKELDFVADGPDDPRLEDRRSHWEDGLKPEVIPTIILAAIMNGKPVKVSFRGAAGFLAGMKLYTLAYEAANEANLPLWGAKYRLTSYPKKNKKGDNYFSMDVQKAGIPNDKERYQAAELSASFQSQVKKQAEDIEEVPF